MAKAPRVRKPDTLTEQQRDFCREYLKDFNGRDAAIRAKYSRKTAVNQASRLLTKVKVQQELARLGERRLKKIEVTADEIIQKFARMADGNVFDYVRKDDKGKLRIDVDGLERHELAAISWIKIGDEGGVTELKLASRERALENLSRIFKVEPPKKVILEHEGEVQHTHRIRQEYTLTTEELRKQISDYLVTHKADGSKAG